MTSRTGPSFTPVMDHDDPTRRLADLGRRPVPDELRAEHLHAMRVAARAGVPATPAPRGFGRLAVAAAALVGFLVGSTGFAMAGALPGPVQGVAHDVLSVVQVDVPDWRNRGECVSTAARAGDDAAKVACPKGGRPEGTPGAGRDGAPGQQGKAPKAGAPAGPNRDDDPCTGKPPWAGPGTPEEKAAARATCPDRAADDADVEKQPDS